MDTLSPSCTATMSTGRLVIHNEGRMGTGRRHLKSLLQWLRSIYSTSRRRDECAPLGLQIFDLQGHRVLALDDAGPLVDVPLPAGTYRVAAHAGSVRRSYTMTLEAGASFDLHLRLVADRL